MKSLFAAAIGLAVTAVVVLGQPSATPVSAESGCCIDCILSDCCVDQCLCDDGICLCDDGVCLCIDECRKVGDNCCDVDGEWCKLAEDSCCTPSQG